MFKTLEPLSHAKQSASMVYLKAYSLTKYVANYHHCDSDNAQQYYKNLNPQGLSDNYSFAILSESVMNCHTSVESIF